MKANIIIPAFNNALNPAESRSFTLSASSWEPSAPLTSSSLLSTRAFTSPPAHGDTQLSAPGLGTQVEASRVPRRPPTQPLSPSPSPQRCHCGTSLFCPLASESGG